MDFYDVVATRYSVRGFDKERVVEEDKLHRIFEAVRCAPTALNNQPYKLIVVRDPEVLAKIAANYSYSWLASAPMIVAVIGSTEAAWHRFNGKSACDIDCAIAMDHLVLAATAEGLGSCWICAYDQDVMAEILGVQAPWEVVALTPLGYATKASAETPRRALNEMIEYR